MQRLCAVKNNFVDCQERVGLRCYWSYGLGLGLVSFGLGLSLGLEPCGLVNITGPLRYCRSSVVLCNAPLWSFAVFSHTL